MKITVEVRAELEAVREAHPDKRLTPNDVLARAEAPDSALHAHFTWDDSEAAARYRLVEAARLVTQVRVLMPTASGSQLSVRAYVSLATDRLRGEGGGYRPIAAVMQSDAWREELLRTARAELAAFEARYRVLADELAPVFAALAEIKAA
jgi:hypothetical protein